MDKNNELLPCPFCGGSVKLERTNDQYSEVYGRRPFWGVVCRNTMNLGGTCAIQQIPSASEEAAIERWNRRAAPAPSSLPRYTQADMERFGKAVADAREARIAGASPAALTEGQIFDVANKHMGRGTRHAIPVYFASNSEILNFARALLAASPADQGEPIEWHIEVAGPAGYVRFETFEGETLDAALNSVRAQNFCPAPDEDGFVTMKVKA